MPSAAAVLRELKAGNDHHVAKRYQHPHQTAARQRELAATQHPHAIVLSCADSRVAPEIILDQGLGDLFDVRVAGNVASDIELASIEYAAVHLHTPLLVVMGHQKCGAVTAAAESGEAEGHLPSLLALIRPAVERAKGAARRSDRQRGPAQRGKRRAASPRIDAGAGGVGGSRRTDGGRRGVFARHRQGRLAAGQRDEDGGAAGTAARIKAMCGKPHNEDQLGSRMRPIFGSQIGNVGLTRLGFHCRAPVCRSGGCALL